MMTHYFQPWVNYVISCLLALATTALIVVCVSAVYTLRQTQQRVCELEYNTAVSRPLRSRLVPQADWCVALREVVDAQR
jgi:hypothetical protein